MICSVLLFACCILPSTAMAVEGKEANVIVTVEHEEKDIFEMYGNVFEESMVESRKSTVDLSSGSVAFTVGMLGRNILQIHMIYQRARLKLHCRV